MADLCDTAAPTGGSAGTAVDSPDPRDSHHARLESPSLFAAGKGGPTAFEVKFLLAEDQARAVEDRLAGRLALDPFADPGLGNGYLTTSVYTDTPALDVFHRTPGFGARKYRVRRYGVAGPVFAERKTKRGDEVRKRRSPVGDGEFDALGEPNPRADWAGEWFRRQAVLRGLRPVCRVTYERVAYMGTAADGGAVRVTFDRNVRGAVTGGWEPVPVDVPSAGPLLPGRVVCEFKFRVAMPVLFKAVVADLGLAPAAVSKYRTFMSTVPVGERGGV